MRQEVLHRRLHTVRLGRPQRQQHVLPREAHVHELRHSLLLRDERCGRGGHISLLQSENKGENTQTHKHTNPHTERDDDRTSARGVLNSAGYERERERRKRVKMKDQGDKREKEREREREREQPPSGNKYVPTGPNTKKKQSANLKPSPPPPPPKKTIPDSSSGRVVTTRTSGGGYQETRNTLFRKRG